MNNVVLSGRLAADPEVKYTQTGKAVAAFNLAVNEGYGDKQKTQFIPIVAWEKIAETIGNNLNKGRRVLIEGRLQVRTYDTNDGQKRRVTEVIVKSIEFLDSKQKKQESPMDSLGSSIPDDEEVPF